MFTAKIIKYMPCTNSNFFVDRHFESFQCLNRRKAIDQRDLKAATQIIEGVGGSQVADGRYKICSGERKMEIT